MDLGEAAWGEIAWTEARVAGRLLSAYATLPYAPIRVSRRFESLSSAPAALRAVESLNWTLDYLEPEDRRLLLAWARSVASGGEVGGSVGAYCRAMDLSRRTFERRRREACARIAAALTAGGADPGA